MITVKSLLEAEKNKSMNLLYLPASKGAVSHDTAHNIRTFASSKGDKSFAVQNEDMKNTLKSIVPHHDHKVIVSPTIFHAADEISKKGHSHLIIHAEASKAKDLESAINKTHGDKFKSISIKHLPKEFSDAKSVNDIDPSIKRGDAKSLLKKEEFEIGDFVKSGLVEGEVLNIHPKYATIISEGKEHKVWTKDLEHSTNQPKRNQLYKESFIYKGYRTKNFTRMLSETFKEISFEESDSYAVLECIKVLDYILGVTDKTIEENFGTVRIQIERLKRYSKKVGTEYITESFVSAVEEELLKFAILEDLRFTTTDRNMIAKVVGFVAGINISNTDPTNAVNQAAIVLRKSQLTPQGWEMIGRLMNVATRAGIRWNKDTFSDSIKKEMKLK